MAGSTQRCSQMFPTRVTQCARDCCYKRIKGLSVTVLWRPGGWNQADQRKLATTLFGQCVNTASTPHFSATTTILAGRHPVKETGRTPSLCPPRFYKQWPLAWFQLPGLQNTDKQQLPQKNPALPSAQTVKEAAFAVDVPHCITLLPASSNEGCSKLADVTAVVLLVSSFRKVWVCSKHVSRR